MTPSGGQLDLAVILPLEDPRGDVVEHLQSWTCDQGLARERYQLVVAGSGEQPGLERDVASSLALHDTFVSVAGGSMLDLYAAAAREARGSILLITEAHCLPHQQCLAAVAAAFAADPDLDAGILGFDQRASSGPSKLAAEWIELSLERWDRAGWPRFHVTGTAIRAESYLSAGGIDPRLGLYATSYLSARLHERGARVAPIEAASLTHIVEDTVGESLAATRSFVSGECRMRAEQDAGFCARYFGSGGIWERRLAYRREASRAMVAALFGAGQHSPRDAPWLLRELLARLPASIAGPGARGRLERAKVRLHKAMAGSPALPRRMRRRSYATAQHATVTDVMLREGSSARGHPEVPEQRIGAERLDQIVAGVHGLERAADRSFRWSEPVAAICPTPTAGSVLRIDTGGLRGDPGSYVLGAFVAGRPLPDELLRTEGDHLELRLPEGVGNAWIVLIARPLVPSREGSSDGRRLGVPVCELTLVAA